MTGLVGRLFLGAAAGAAATTALDAATYADMALRGRAASSTPKQTVERIAEAGGLTIPGEGERRENRLVGLGALSGIATGVTFGAAYGVLRPLLPGRSSVLAGTLTAGLGAMAVSNAGMVRYGVTDPRRWSAADWLGDLVPHLAYGLVLSSTYNAADRRMSRT